MITFFEERHNRAFNEIFPRVFSFEKPATYGDFYDLYCVIFQYLADCDLYQPDLTAERLLNLVKHHEKLVGANETEKEEVINDFTHAY